MLFLSVVPLLPVGRYSDDWHLVLRLCEPWKNQRKRLVNDVAAASTASTKLLKKRLKCLGFHFLILSVIIMGKFKFEGVHMDFGSFLQFPEFV